jgi:hypothetical protein
MVKTGTAAFWSRIVYGDRARDAGARIGVNGRYTDGLSTSALPMLPTDPADIARTLADLKLEHRDLDQVIERLSSDPSSDELQLKRLKKRKLRIKDMMTYLESKLIPDLDA